MRTITKNEVVAVVKNLNMVIDFITPENCYDKVIEFFTITSYLQDHAKELEALLPPIEGFKFCWIKSPWRRKSEARRARAEAALRVFIKEINKVGRDGRNSQGCNRTDQGEAISSNDLYFGEDSEYGRISPPMSVAGAKECGDKDVERIMRRIIYHFVKSCQSLFDTRWITD